MTKSFPRSGQNGKVPFPRDLGRKSFLPLYSKSGYICRRDYSLYSVFVEKCLDVKRCVSIVIAVGRKKENRTAISLSLLLVIVLVMLCRYHYITYGISFATNSMTKLFGIIIILLRVFKFCCISECY